MRLTATKSLLVLLFGTALVSSAEAQTPRKISYQGVLTQPNGTPLTTGNYEVTFKIYDQVSGGTVLFTETHSVQVTDGYFGVEIGSTNPNGLPASLTFDRPYFLGVTIGSGPELEGRTQFTAAPYAFKAITADSARAVAPGAIGAEHLQDGSVSAAKLSATGSSNGQLLVSNGLNISWRNASDVAVTSLNNQKGALSIVAGPNTTVTTSGSQITIGAAAGITSVGAGDAAIVVQGGNGPNVTLGIAGGSLDSFHLAPSGVSTSRLANGAVTTPKIADGAVTDAKVANGISYSKLSGAPTSLPPSGAAGGDLTGTYPNPTIANDAVTSAKIADGAIVDADISATAAIAYSKIAGTPTSLPPSGAAGGDLSGTYPNPTVAAGAITTSKIADDAVTDTKIASGAVTDAKVANGISYSKLSGAPTSLPPSGAAGGDLTGTYPNPTIAASAVVAMKIADGAVTTPKIIDGGVTSAKILDGTIVNADVSPTAAIAYSKLNLTNSIVTGDIVDGAITDAKVANGISYSKLSGAPTSLPPSGAAGGDLTGTYPNPTIAANAVTSAKIADGTIVNADVSPTAAIAYSKLALTNSIVTTDLTNGSVTTAKLADSAVTSLKLGTAAVSTAHIQDGAVTDAKVANGISYSKLSGAPTSLPPSGAAGGDLTGTYPNPTVATNAVTTTKIADGAVTDAKVANGISYSKLSGVPTSLPPSGAAGGDLTGTYPNPTVATNAVTTTKIADGAVTTLKIADGAVTDAKVANGISYSKLSGAPTSLPPSGAAGGDLTGTYPNPTIAANAVTSAKIADGTITNADISAAASIAYSKLSLTGSIQGSDVAAGTFTTTNAHIAVGNSDNTARTLRLLEPSGSGVNYTAFRAQAQAGDITYTLPNSAPTSSNQVLQVQAVAGNNATLSWGSIGGGSILFARTGVIANAGNTSYTVQAADDIVGIDMSAGTNFTVNLPPATTAGEILVIKIEKYNNGLLPVLTLQPNGTDKIDNANNLAFGNANGNRRLYSDGAGNWYTW